MRDQQTTLAGELTEPYRDRALLHDLYKKQEKSVPEIAEELDCSDTTVRNYLRRFGMLDPLDSPAYYTSRPDGYDCWIVDGHTVRVHRLVAVAEWGVETVANAEAIHHRNTHKWDNRPTNLLPCETRAKHAREHHRPRADDTQRSLDKYPTTDELSHPEGNGHRDADQLTFDDFEAF